MSEVPGHVTDHVISLVALYLVEVDFEKWPQNDRFPNVRFQFPPKSR